MTPHDNVAGILTECGWDLHSAPGSVTRDYVLDKDMDVSMYFPAEVSEHALQHWGSHPTD